ncbi:Leucyl aminopeptidase yscIV [Coemansia sp. BCRC 34301]|nr:Leucyl aminopeptidase yscIV [Coemansia sp. BCRC 34301]
MPNTRIDASSQANLAQTTTKHVHLELGVDFKSRTLSGHVLITGEMLEDSVDCLVLDTSNLEVKGVLVKNGGQFANVKYSLSSVHPVCGRALSVSLPQAQKGHTFCVKINYTTTPESSAIQFLTPEQTLGKKYPYLFTQCQPIHARSFFPCQDSPSVKIAYSANIRVPKPLTALMSAIATGSCADGDSTVFSFEQTTTIPSYLVALVVGNLTVAKVSDRCAVWSEPENIDACAWEFAEMEAMLQTAEELITPYLWGRYDLLVLPPSFPFGGMENPCLTFVTPTLLAGDRSLTDVVAHEIAHSWSGNLVTAKNWEHFWLNEGWTTYFERRIVARLSGEDARQLGMSQGYKSLSNDIALYGSENQLTALIPDLSDVNPDDAYSRVPYEKGSLLIYHLEQALDPVVWSHISKMYIHEFSGCSIGSGDFYDFLKRYARHYLDEAGERKLDAVDWDSWFKKPGMPPVTFQFETSLQKASIDLAERWWAARDSVNLPSDLTADQFEALSAPQKVLFFSALGDKGVLTRSLLQALERVYGLSTVRNCEVRFSWLHLALNNGYEAVFSAAAQMLGEQGRMKYTRPLYRALANCGQQGRELAVSTFEAHRGFYHPICLRLVASDLGL